MNANAEQVVESLRLGIPPDGFVRYFTVGRHTEIDQLRSILINHAEQALLLKANYGSGKSHLLRFIRETALKENYAVSSLTLDAKAGVRFNRMDQIVGEIFRNLEVPGGQQKGINVFFDWVLESQNYDSEEWKDITNNGKWNYPRTLLNSPALFLALRAWNNDRPDKDMIQDWLYQRGSYTTGRIISEVLYNYQFRTTFARLQDKLKWSNYTNSQLLNWRRDSYQQCWDAIDDLNTLAIISGLKGLIILFDEFEDVIYNLNNIDWQIVAFNNLFHFFQGHFFKGISIFAVTPGFVEKCQDLLHRKIGSRDYDHFFDNLKTFEMSPLEKEHLRELAYKIRDFHGQTYGWNVHNNQVEDAIIKAIIEGLSRASNIQDRTRFIICEVVKCLDTLLEDED